MDKFARSSAEDRLAIIQEAASRRDLSAAIIEKDFWVCWTLRRLSEHADLGSDLTFKGGTSLSKAYGIIERFSEDIDLTIGRTAPFIRDTLPPMEADISGNELKRRADAQTAAAKRYVAELTLPALNTLIEAALATKDGWRVVLDEADAQTILFYYPKLANYGAGFGRGAFGVGAFGEGEYGYIKPHIKLEFGARGEIEPHEERSFTPYVAEEFPDLFVDAVTTFSTLAAERTFWEKATILHALHHGSKMRDRMSRHYYDVYMLMQKGVAKAALQAPELLAQVVRNKSLLFRDPKASYETALFGSLKLVPSAEEITALKRDYAAMGEMFMGDVPNFDTVMDAMAELEAMINRQALTA